MLRELKLLRDDGDVTRTSTFAILRRIRGRLLLRPQNDPDGSQVTVVASGRGAWTGWVDLIKDRIEERAISNTARVIREVGADIVGVIEAEDRLTLARFTDSLLLTGRRATAVPACHGDRRERSPWHRRRTPRDRARTH